MVKKYLLGMEMQEMKTNKLFLVSFANLAGEDKLLAVKNSKCVP